VNRTEIEFELNERSVTTWVWAHQSLLEVLRDEVGSTDVKYGCGEGVCGTCTVLLDGEAVNSCLMLAVQVAGHSIMTLRGLPRNGEEMHPLQESFLQHGASQCGFCTPGMVLVAHTLLERGQKPSREEIREAITGNLCRCTGYTKIVDAVESYVRAGRAEGAPPAEGVAGTRTDHSDGD
jgi:aerobic carbon-monoxide dehydrogenase small subunit